MSRFITRAKILFATFVLLGFCAATKAESNEDKKETLLVVGAKYDQLSLATRQTFGDVNVVEIEFSPEWRRYIDQADADKIIMRHPSGFTGLYSQDGTLLRDLGTSPSAYAYPYAPPTMQAPPANANYLPTPSWHPTGYSTGGRTDPYRTTTMPAPKRNYQALAPGWGYNREKAIPSKRDTLYQFLSFFPVDTVSPFNYPGTYDAASVPFAYGLGVIPHIGGLALEMRTASKQQEIYEANAAAIPEYAEFPVQMNNYMDPNNPITRDPNYNHLSPMPQAFNVNNPQYEERAEYYRQHGSNMP